MRCCRPMIDYVILSIVASTDKLRADAAAADRLGGVVRLGNFNVIVADDAVKPNAYDHKLTFMFISHGVLCFYLHFSWSSTDVSGTSIDRYKILKHERKWTVGWLFYSP